MKRIFDILFSAISLVVLSPVLLLVPILVLLTMGRPVFFLQERVGKGGKLFRIIKFRSMVKGAEQDGLPVTTGGDRRVTPLGKFLRRTKIDEIPQLLNVLIGDMSVVGPRPEVAKYVALYDRNQQKVMMVKPGLTDPASIAFSNEEALLATYPDTERAYIEEVMPAKLKLNLAYLEKAGFLSDLSLVFKTVITVIRRK
jgi:lipopolysaccharide/colanic/teichoic acid biosynthesis glycosyltransferase